MYCSSELHAVHCGVRRIDCVGRAQSTACVSVA
jgi:hypothetical protein